MTNTKTYDICIVGAGIAGALIATQAIRKGRTVALIEAGDKFDFTHRLDQLRHHQIVGGLRWPWPNKTRDGYVDATLSSIGVPYLLDRHRLKGVGGSTLHWGGRINRLMPSDFRTASTYGLGTDWPLTYADLEPYYSQAEWEIGVAGSAHPMHPPRSRDFPMPGFPMSVDDRMWLPIAERLGISVYAASFAINSQPYGGRSQCQAFAACNICPSGARYSADFHVREAEASSLCDLFVNTVARRIDLDSSGGVKAIHASTLEGKELEIRAKSYVVAAHAIESARLLLLSNCGNHSDQVGRNFIDHVYVGAGGYLPQKRFYPVRVGYEVLESLSYYDGQERHQRGAIKLEFSFDNDPLVDIGSNHRWGRALADYDRKKFGHWVGIEAETELQPKSDSRIILDSQEKDLFGDPVPNVRLAFSDVDRRTQSRGREIMSQLLEASGATDVEQEKLSATSFGSHHIGTCRMADDADKGVVDRNCRVHGTSNLYVAGSSVFPTGGAVQPTISVAALSLRLAEHLLRSTT